MKINSPFPLQEMGGNEIKLFHLPPISWEEMEELCFISLTVEVFEKIYYVDDVDVNGQCSQAVRASSALKRTSLWGTPQRCCQFEQLLQTEPMWRVAVIYIC